MAEKSGAEILVIGAGPVGLMAGVMLAERGIPFRIMDQEWRTGLHNYALALHPASLKILKNLGLLDEVLAQSRRVDSIGLYDHSKRRVQLKLSDLPSGIPFVAVLPQSGLEGILEERLRKFGVGVQWNRRIADLQFEDSCVSATVEELSQESAGYPIASSVSYIKKTAKIEAGFVIGADGYNSAVRRALGIPFEPVGPTEWYAASEFLTDLESEAEVRIMLGEGTTNVLWPVDGRRCRGLFEIDQAEMGSETQRRLQRTLTIGEHSYPYLPEKRVTELLESRASHFPAKIDEVLWSAAVRFERRLVASFGHGRAWLAGDAAHVTCPVGVHSTNAGFFEVADLVSRIERGLRPGADVGELFESFNREHLAEWRMLLGLERAPRPEKSADPWVAEQRMKLLPSIPATGADLRSLLGQLGLEV